MESTIELCWDIYSCSVKDWERYKDWKTVDEFIDFLMDNWERKKLEILMWLWGQIFKSKNTPNS